MEGGMIWAALSSFTDARRSGPRETAAKVPLQASEHAHKWHGEGVELGFCAFLQQSPRALAAVPVPIRVPLESDW